MARATRAELVKKVQGLEEQLKKPPDVHAITIVYNSSGVPIVTPSTSINQASDLGALKTALAAVAREVDVLLLRAIDQEAEQRGKSAIAESEPVEQADE